VGIKIGLLGGETDGEERMVQTEKQENLISDAFKATASFTNGEIFINILTFCGRWNSGISSFRFPLHKMFGFLISIDIKSKTVLLYILCFAC
jgi:hypothetical protein